MSIMKRKRPQSKRSSKDETIPIVRDQIGAIRFPSPIMAGYVERMLDILFEVQAVGRIGKSDDGQYYETERNAGLLIIWKRR